MKLKRKILCFLLVFILLFTIAGYAVEISIDGSKIGFTNESGVPFVDSSNRTQVPLRVTMESFGATVGWDNSTNSATVEKNGINVRIPIGQSYIIKNGQKIPNDTAAIIKDGRTYLPIRVVLEAFGASVGWDGATQTVTVTKDPLEEIKIHFIDVGQADSILIELPNNIEILIDAGNKDDAYTIINYINNLGIDHIEHFILTHFHEDHIGSAPDIIHAFYVDKVYTPETIADTDIYEATMAAIEDEDMEIIRAKGGKSIIDTASLAFEFLGPNSIYYSEANEYSLVTKLTYGDTSFLFMGDAESVSELEMVRGDYDLDVDLLKVGHHGGETSSSQIFLNEVTPAYAVISVGAFNNYGHPHEKTLNRLNAIGAKIYRTDIQGTVVATSDGSNITIDKEATEYVPEPIKEVPVKTIPTNNDDTATESTAKYIGNSNTHKLHYPSCGSVNDMKETNKVFFLLREDAISNGYIPCKRCNP